jgi:myo-inositol-1(or 4)-monophosphatase
VPEVHALLELAKSVAIQAGTRLLDGMTGDGKNYVHCLDHPREVKAIADTMLDKDILQSLESTGLAILSEESGYIPARADSNYWFIVDPLDGTFNFVKGLGPSAISIALWEGDRPVFGVIYSVAERKLAWGGVGIGAFADGRRISVSDTSSRAQASICTGFPVLFDVANDGAMRNFWRTVTPYAKVRMLGSAAVSLLHVATGAADAYSEQGIMLWDVAAGLAIVDGAGGKSVMEKADSNWCYRVFASNASVFSSFSGAASE